MIAKRIIELKIAARRICAEAQNKSDVPLKVKTLYLLSVKPRQPFELISALAVVKSNLAAIMRELIADGFAEKNTLERDHREIVYNITKEGEKELLLTLERIQKHVETALSPEEREDAERKLEAAADILSFI